MSICVIAKDSLLDLFKFIDIKNKAKVESIVISMEDLTLMKNHIEDLEMEVEGFQKRELDQFEKNRKSN